MNRRTSDGNKYEHQSGDLHRSYSHSMPFSLFRSSRSSRSSRSYRLSRLSNKLSKSSS